MKKIIAIALVLMMTLALVACTPKAEEETPDVSAADVSAADVSGADVSGADAEVPAFVGGTYKITAAEKDGVVVEGDALANLEGVDLEAMPTFSFKADGTGTITFDKQDGAIKWTLDGEKLTVSEDASEDKIELTVDEDKLIWEIEGVKMIFTK